MVNWCGKHDSWCVVTMSPPLDLGVAMARLTPGEREEGVDPVT